MGPEEEFKLYDRERSWHAVFQKLHATDAVRKHEYSLHESKRTENRYRNRYRDVTPYDHSRIQLERNNIDYINASLVLADEADRAYILTQGPLPDTSGHFWLMVWEQKSRAVLMLNRVVEKGQVKCHPYYPTGQENDDDDDKNFEDVGLKVTFVEERESNPHYVERVLQLTDLESQETREVLQFHYTAWPDFGVPSSPSAFLDFLWAVRKSDALDCNVYGPPVIHCSAGIGRSGTFCLVDACLVMIEKRGSASDIRVLDLLMDMRRYRMGLVQTHDQLRFSYLAIIEGIQRVLRFPSRDSGFDNSVEDQVHTADGEDSLHFNNAMKTSSDEGGDTDFDEDECNDDEDDDDIPPPIPPRLGHSGRPLARSAGDALTDGKGVINGRSFPYENHSGAKEDWHFGTSDGVWQHTDIRRRRPEERVKNSAEQIARMKQRRREHNFPPHSKRFRPYVFGATVVALVAIGSYALYRYYWR